MAFRQLVVAAMLSELAAGVVPKANGSPHSLEQRAGRSLDESTT